MKVESRAFTESFACGLAAFRGLWDRSAPPNSVSAFKRAYIKQIPFIVDLASGKIDCAELVREGLFSQTRVSVYVKVSDLSKAIELLEPGEESANVHFVHPAEDTRMWSLISKRKAVGMFTPCGYYVPFMSCQVLDDGSTEPFMAAHRQEDAHVVVYESCDTVSTIEEMRRFAHVNDNAVLASLVRNFGENVGYIKVSDLVEREFLARQMEG